MFESGVTAVRDIRNVQAAKAFNVDLVNLSYAYSQGSSRDHIASLLRSLAYGATWGASAVEAFPNPYGPYSPKVASYYFTLRDLRDFSAEVNGIPLVSENVISFSPGYSGELSGSIWVSPRKVYIAVYNDADGPRNFSVKMDGTTVRRYGWKADALASATQTGGEPATRLAGCTEGGDSCSYKVLREDGTREGAGTLRFADEDGIIRLEPVSLGPKQLLLSSVSSSLDCP